MTSLESNAAQSQESSSAHGLASLRGTFGGWDKQQLIDYAVATTQALSDEKAEVRTLTSRYNTAQDWALGLALVEEIGQSLASTLDLKEVLIRILRRTYNAIDVEDGSILLIEEHSGDLVAQVVLGSVSAPFRVPRGEGIAGEVAATGVPIIVNNAKDDPRHFKEIDRETGFVTKSIMCVPLLRQGSVIGVLEVFNKKSGLFTRKDQLLLSSIANYAAIAIENARLHQSVVAERDRVIRAEADVSHRLQRDLHDGPAQLVAAIQMGLEYCAKALEHDQIELANQEIEDIRQIAQRATHQLRTLLFELRPLVLETKGLVAALSIYVERRQTEAGVTQLQLEWQSDQPDNQISRLEAKSEAALFAIVQESVNNALKHARANNIVISLAQMNEQITVSIADDGQGFDVASVSQDYADRGSYGMINLQERVAVAGGEYAIDSKIGSGTKIQVKVPLSSAAS
jgi:signal transduction histidine kinase